MSEFNKTIRSLKGARNVAAAVGLLDSAYGIFAASYGQTVQMWGIPWLAFLTASLVTVLVAYLVDWGLHANSLTAMRGILREPAANVSPSFYWWVGVLCVIQFSFGILSAVYTRPFAVDAVTVAPMVESAAAAQERATAATTAQMTALDADIARIQKVKADALASTGNVTLRSMAKAGNAWASIKLANAKNRVSARFDAQIEAKDKAKNELLTTTTATIATTVDGINTQNAAKWGNYVGKKGSLNWVLLGITLLCSAVFLLTTTILAQYDETHVVVTDNTPPPPKRNGKPKSQQTTSTGSVTGNAPDVRYNAVTDGNEGQQRNNTHANPQHGAVKFDNGYYVFLHTPDGGAKWYEESKLKAAHRTRKGQYQNPPKGNRDGQLVKSWMDTLAGGVAAIETTKTQNAQG